MNNDCHDLVSGFQAPCSATRISGRLTFVMLLFAFTTALSDQAPSYSGLEPDEFMKTWLVLGPIPVSEEASPDEMRQKTAFAEDLLKAAGGAALVRASAGAQVAIDGKIYRWRSVQSSSDTVNLAVAKEPEAFAIAYAWAEIEMPAARKALLGIGSNDGVKVWLNGRLIHENWIGRPVRADNDIIAADFVRGRNRLLVKIQNMRGPWGFASRLLGPQAQAERLIAAGWNGDLDAARLLIDRGVDVNSRAASGLTAIQAARLRGRNEMVAFLAGKGADTQAAIPPRGNVIDALLKRAIESDAPGAAVLVAQNGKILFEKGYGLASVEHGVAVTPRTRFRIGSLTKQFTAAAILRLQEQGKLSVNDRLSKFIAGYPRGNEVTVHHLLTHTSGIHNYTTEPDFLETVTLGVKPEDHIESFKDDPFDFDPGEKWVYSNSGYFLLGHIIEKVSGKSYGDYLREAFFEPLDMKDSGVHEATAVLAREATGYSFEGTGLRKALDWDMSRAGAAGALYSTVQDLYRWNEALFSGKVLSEASLEAAFVPVKIAEDDPVQPKEAGYGYGWMVQKFRGRQEISHGGGLHGFLSHLLRLPEERFTVAVLVNCWPTPPGVDLDPGALAREIVDAYLGETLAPRAIPKIDTNVSAAALEDVVGRYDYGTAILTVTREGDRIFAQLAGQPRFEIFPKSDNTFFWKVVEARVTFVKDENGRVNKAIHRQGGQTLHAPRLQDLQEAKVDPKLYDIYAGRYDYGGKAILTVTREGDRLFAQLTGQPKLEIFPSSETEFFWKVVNAQITFVKDDDGKVRGAIHEQAGRTFDAPRMK